jgi:hypothetical protein
VLNASDGVDCIIDAMKAFPWNENVQAKACWVLSMMASSYGECALTAAIASELQRAPPHWLCATAHVVGEKGGVQAILRGMVTCKDDYQVQVFGVRCLSVLLNASRTYHSLPAPTDLALLSHAGVHRMASRP